MMIVIYQSHRKQHVYTQNSYDRSSKIINNHYDA